MRSIARETAAIKKGLSPDGATAQAVKANMSMRGAMYNMAVTGEKEARISAGGMLSVMVNEQTSEGCRNCLTQNKRVKELEHKLDNKERLYAYEIRKCKDSERVLAEEIETVLERLIGYKICGLDDLRWVIESLDSVNKIVRESPKLMLKTGSGEAERSKKEKSHAIRKNSRGKETEDFDGDSEFYGTMTSFGRDTTNSISPEKLTKTVQNSAADRSLDNSPAAVAHSPVPNLSLRAGSKESPSSLMTSKINENAEYIEASNVQNKDKDNKEKDDTRLKKLMQENVANRFRMALLKTKKASTDDELASMSKKMNEAQNRAKLLKKRLEEAKTEIDNALAVNVELTKVNKKEQTQRYHAEDELKRLKTLLETIKKQRKYDYLNIDIEGTEENADMKSVESESAKDDSRRKKEKTAHGESRDSVDTKKSDRRHDSLPPLVPHKYSVKEREKQRMLCPVQKLINSRVAFQVQEEALNAVQAEHEYQHEYNRSGWNDRKANHGSRLMPGAMPDDDFLENLYSNANAKYKSMYGQKSTYGQKASMYGAQKRRKGGGSEQMGHGQTGPHQIPGYSGAGQNISTPGGAHGIAGSGQHLAFGAQYMAGFGGSDAGLITNTSNRGGPLSTRNKRSPLGTPGKNTPGKNTPGKNTPGRNHTPGKQGDTADKRTPSTPGGSPERRPSFEKKNNKSFYGEGNVQMSPEKRSLSREFADGMVGDTNFGDGSASGSTYATGGQQTMETRYHSATNQSAISHSGSQPGQMGMTHSMSLGAPMNMSNTMSLSARDQKDFAGFSMNSGPHNVEYKSPREDLREEAKKPPREEPKKPPEQLVEPFLAALSDYQTAKQSSSPVKKRTRERHLERKGIHAPTLTQVIRFDGGGMCDALAAHVGAKQRAARQNQSHQPHHQQNNPKPPDSSPGGQSLGGHDASSSGNSPGGHLPLDVKTDIVVTLIPPDNAAAPPNSAERTRPKGNAKPRDDNP